jgi:hypothetical protein
MVKELSVYVSLSMPFRSFVANCSAVRSIGLIETRFRPARLLIEIRPLSFDNPIAQHIKPYRFHSYERTTEETLLPSIATRFFIGRRSAPVAGRVWIGNRIQPRRGEKIDRGRPAKPAGVDHADAGGAPDTSAQDGVNGFSEAVANRDSETNHGLL